MATNKHLLNINFDDDDWREDYREHLKLISNAKSTEDLLKRFKDLTSKLKADGCDEFHLRKLLKIYFQVQGKHPIKNSIQFFFNQLKNDNEAVKIFDLELCEHINSYQNVSFEQQFDLVSTLNDLSQNFIIANKSVGRQANFLLDFLHSITQKSFDHLKSESSASKKNELCHRLHNCLQASIFCIKSHIHDENDETFELKLNDFINNVCMEILNHNDVPLETKNLCALLFVIRNVDYAGNSSHIDIIFNNEESPMKRLCLIFAMIQTMNEETDIILIENLCAMLEAIYKDNSVNSVIIHAVSRSFAMLTKKVVLLNSLDYSTHHLQSITKSILTISFLNLEHYNESVRHMSRTLLTDLSEIAVRIKLILNEIFIKINSITSISLQAIVINAIQFSITFKDILERLPNFQATLLNSIATNKEHKLSCYEILANKCYKENEFDDFYMHFIKPIVEKIQHGRKNDEEYQILKKMLLKCVKKDKRAIQILLDIKNFDIGLHLSCLSVAKMENILEDISSTEKVWKGVIEFDEIKNYMVNIDVDIRLSALLLIVDTKKTTEYFTKEEIECILYFFENNINVQSPSMRQSLLDMIKRIFNRFHGFMRALKKRNDDHEIQEQLNVLLKFYRFCMDNLNDTANFSRRSLSLKILENVLIIIREHFPTEAQNIWNSSDFNKLFNIFYDTFESNKEMALNVMEYVPQSQVITNSCITSEYLEALLSSVKPADSLTGTYLTLFSLKFSLFSPETTSHSNIQPQAYKILIWCEEMLHKALTVCEKSIILAAGTNPMYGFILCMRHIIRKLDLNSLKMCHLWQSFFGRLVTVCRQLTNVIASIVNDESPEGMYPQENLNDDDEEIMKIVQNTTSQMILLCAWRTVKEVCLLLGDISLKAPIKHNDFDGILNVNQMHDIGDHFLELLSNIKHRGAFEQSFCGFSQFCIALRKSDIDELHNLPVKILQDIIDVISSKNMTHNDFSSKIKNLCATRRSAGLPFIVQALLSSELKISQSKNFHYVMQHLINFITQSKHLETKIHSLNILRAIFRCKEFNETINEYVAPALQCSILGYNSNSWAEKNSSTLLYSALMVRIFGVQRNKDSDDLNIKNKMSGKIFFTRYPELYDFFMNQLKDSVEYVRKQKMNSKLHPLLLLLNRLFVSITDNSETNLKLTEFIPIVTMCSSCVEYQTRILCAKFIANVIQPNQLMSRIIENINTLRESKIANSKHGTILEILYLLRNTKTDDDDNMIQILNGILNTIEIFKYQMICFGTLLDCIIEICQKISHRILNDTFLLRKLKNCFDFDQTTYFGLNIQYSKIIMIKLLSRDMDFILDLKTCMHNRELLGKLNCIVFILNDNVATEYEIDSKFVKFFNSLPFEFRYALNKEIRSGQTLKNDMKRMAKSSDIDFSSRSYEILSNLEYLSGECNLEQINTMIEHLDEKQPEILTASIIKYLNIIIQGELQFLNEIDFNFFPSLSNSSDLTKLAIIDILKTLKNNANDIKLFNIFYTFIKCTVQMLFDEEFEIREKSSSNISELVGLKQVFTGPHALKIFLQHLLYNSLFAIDKDKVIAMIVLLMFEEREEDECEKQSLGADMTCELQVFEKNEMISFKEPFIIKKICLNILSDELRSNKNDDYLTKLSYDCCKIKNSVNSSEILKFIRNNMIEN